MQARTSLLGKSTGLLGAVVALLCATGASAQVSFATDFDTGVLPGGVSTNFFLNNLTGPTCSGTGWQLTRNIWSSAQTGEITGFAGVSTGVNLVTWTFDYRSNTWGSGNTVPSSGNWGSIFCEWSNTPSGPWTIAGSVVNEAQTGACINHAFTFTPTAGAVFFRFRCVWGGAPADEYFNIDNVSIQEPCTGTPNPGNTVGPVEACPGGNITLSLQNVVAGSGVSYQWRESTVSGTGPWTNVGVSASTHVTTQAVNTWYSCVVTCGANSGTSASLAVPMSAGATLPQDWSAGVVDPNCWSVEQIAGTGLPLYNTVSANGVGTGSVQFDGWSFGATVENALISPLLTASPGGQFLMFDAAGASWFTSVDVVHIEESNDGGTTWNTIVSLDNAATGGVLNTTALVNPNDWAPGASDWVNLFYPVSAGTDRVRFRWDSAFGNNIYIDNVNIINNPPAYHATIGTGCYNVDNQSTVAELFGGALAAKTALDGNSLSFINTGSGYLALWTTGGGAAYVAPTTPTPYAVGDEGTATITPSSATPSPNGPVTDWTIQANGALTAGTISNGSGWTADLNTVGAAANLGFWSFHDFDQSGAGQVVSEEVGNMLYITWDAVGGFGQPADLGTFQYQINMTTGDVSIVWVSMPSVDIELNFVAGTLAGVEPAPTSVTLSTATPVILSNDQLGMELTVAGRPVNGGPAPTYTINNLPEYFPGAGFSTLAVIFGFTVFPGGIDLGPGPFDIGAPGCNGYITPDVIVIIGVVPFAPVSFPIAWNIPSTPGQLFMQAVSEFIPNTLPNGQNAGGKIVSNALEIFIEAF